MRNELRVDAAHEELNLAADHIVVIVLAAGRSRRMGGRQKLLLPWRDGEPILHHVAAAALAAHPLEVVVVVRPDLIELRGETGGRLLVRHYPDRVARVPLPASARPLDIDTPEDYAAALET